MNQHIVRLGAAAGAVAAIGGMGVGEAGAGVVVFSQGDWMGYGLDCSASYQATIEANQSGSTIDSHTYAARLNSNSCVGRQIRFYTDDAKGSALAATGTSSTSYRLSAGSTRVSAHWCFRVKGSAGWSGWKVVGYQSPTGVVPGSSCA